MNFTLLRAILINQTKSMTQFIEDEPSSLIDENQVRYCVHQAITSIADKIEQNPFGKYAEHFFIGAGDVPPSKKEAIFLSAQAAIAQKGFSNELMPEIACFTSVGTTLENVGSLEDKQLQWFLVIKEF